MDVNTIPLDVLCVGATSYDLYFSVGHPPRPDDKTTASAFSSCGGGPAANAAVTVARMGLSVGFAGYLGRDAFGDMHLSELRRAGVETRWVARGDAPTPVSAVWVGKDGERSLVNYRSPGARLEADQVGLFDAAPRVILFDGHEPALTPGLLDKARKEDIRTVLDAGSVHPGTVRLFREVDYLICSAKFAAEMTRCAVMADALEALSSQCRSVAITLGERGLIWRAAGESGAISAFPVEALDTTGAGDVFHGAFAGCIARNIPWEEALEHAGAWAALCCTRPGARDGIPTMDEVLAFTEQRKSSPPSFGSSGGKTGV